MIKLLTVEK